MSVHLYLILSRLNDFCNGLRAPFNDQTIKCGLLLDRFSITIQHDPTAGQASHNYFLTVFSTWMNLLLWTATVVVMMLRCFYGTDFELIDMPPPMEYHIEGYQNKHNGDKGIYVDEFVEHDRSGSMQEGISNTNSKKSDIRRYENEYGTMTKTSRFGMEPDDFTVTELCFPENNIGPMMAMSAWPQQPERRKLINEVAQLRETALNV